MTKIRIHRQSGEHLDVVVDHIVGCCLAGYVYTNAFELVVVNEGEDDICTTITVHKADIPIILGQIKDFLRNELRLEGTKRDTK